MSLKLCGVTKQYGQSKNLTLDSIDLTIEDGEFICIVGPSGCGKSTLLNLIAGLESVTEGEILLDDVKVQEPGADRAVMFQESALFPWLNVKENVMFGMQLAHLNKEEQEKRADYYLKMVQLYAFREYPIHQLSGGMKQRTALARALCLDSRLLLMDEPFSALDKQTINLLRDEVEVIWMKTKKTILFVTHSVEEAVFFADRVIVLSENPGRIKAIHKIDVPRPRHIESEEFLKLRKLILDEVRKEVQKVAEEEYDKK